MGEKSYIIDGKDIRFGARESRGEYWMNRYLSDLNDATKSDFDSRVETARQWMEKDIQAILKAQGITLDAQTYWYKGTFTGKVFRFLKGVAFQSDWRVRFKMDSRFGSEDSDMMREISDLFTNEIRRDDEQDNWMDCHDSYYSTGFGIMRNRIDKHVIDRRFGKPRIVGECVPVERVVLDSGCYDGRNFAHIFHAERLLVEEIESMFPDGGEIKEGVIADGVVKEDNADTDGRADLVQVEFWRMEPVQLFQIDEGLAGYLGVPRILSAAEYMRVGNAVLQEEGGVRGGLQALLKNSQRVVSMEPVWYYDAIANKRSLLDSPLPLAANGNDLGISACDYQMARWMKLKKSAYPVGLPYEMQDELILAILSLTVLVRQIIQLEGDWVFVNLAALGKDGAKIVEDMKNGSGIIGISMDEIFKDIRQNIVRIRREDDVAGQILGIVSFILGRVEDQGGVTNAQTGKAEFAGIASSLQSMLELRSALQNVPGELGFKRLVRRNVMHRAVLYQKMGIISKDIDLSKLEVNIDTRSQEQRTARAGVLGKYMEMGISGPERIWEEEGWSDGPEIMQAEQMRQLGMEVSSDPEMMMVLRQRKQAKGSGL